MKITQQNTDLKIKFDGQVNQIDVNTLINSLLHITNAIAEVNNELCKEIGEYKKIEVKVNAFSSGSFLVHLELIESLGDVLNHLFSRETVEYLSWIAGILGTTIALKQFLKSKKPEKVEQTSSTSFTITNTEGSTTVIDNRTFNLYFSNENYQQALTKTFETLDNDPSVTGFEITDNLDTPVIAIQQDSFKTLAVPIEAYQDNTKIENDIEARLSVFKIVFDEGRKWEFYYRGNRISAKVSDDEFFQRINEGEKFAKGDLLVVSLNIHQSFDKTANTFINKYYEVVKVHAHIPRPEQQSLEMPRKQE
jgi:hypothetical protein